MTRYKLRFIPFPENMKDVYGFITWTGSNPMIVLDANMTEEDKTLNLKHELAHLELDHMNCFRDLAEIEAEAEARAAEMTDQELEALKQWEIK